MPGRKHANDPLSIAINRVIGKYGSDEKLGKKIGASRHTVMRWRLGDNRPDKPEYVDFLRREGVPADLLESPPPKPSVDAKLDEILGQIQVLGARVAGVEAILQSGSVPQQQPQAGRAPRESKG